MSCQFYYTEIEVIYSNKQVESNCNSITFINTGGNNLTINNYLLAPGVSFVVQGNDNEMDTTMYNILFISGPAANQLTVIRKIYK